MAVDEAQLLTRFGALVRADPVPLGEAALVAAAVLGHPQTLAGGMPRTSST